MQTQYFVSHDGQDMGAKTIEQIVGAVNSGELAITDYVYDETKQDWVLILECPEIHGLLSGKKPKGPPPKQKNLHHLDDSKTFSGFGEKTVVAQAQATPVTVSGEWFVLKWDNRYGPFSYLEVLKMLQEKAVFEFDYVWCQGMDSWRRIAELEAFHADAIKSLSQSSETPVSEVFFRRRHMRTTYNGSIIVHDNQTVWRGESLEISEGGAGLVMYNALMLPGQQIYLHFKPGDSVPPFNAVCEVISKKYVKGVRDKGAPITYGVRFLKINKLVKDAIREYVMTKAA